MEPISAAIIAAIGGGAASAVPKVLEKAINDAYDLLKGLIHKKFGSDSELVNAVTDVEKHPDSEGRKRTLKEEVEKAGASGDPEIVEAASKLSNALRKVRTSVSGQQTATGSNIAMAANDSTASVNVGYLTPLRD